MYVTKSVNIECHKQKYTLQMKITLKYTSIMVFILTSDIYIYICVCVCVLYMSHEGCFIFIIHYFASIISKISPHFPSRCEQNEL